MVFRQNQVFAFLLCMRPRQWTKNLLVFAALLFSINKINLVQVLDSVLGFILFCLASSAVYVFNDLIDRERDSQHPKKRNRPIACGMVSPQFAMVGGLAILCGALYFAFTVNFVFGLILLGYFVINFAYSVKLKQVVIVDIMIIASGFVLRAVAGGVIIGVPLTPWFLLCILLLALFLAISKRRHELCLLEGNSGYHRTVLKYYSPQLLDQLNSIVISAAVMSYALYTFTSGKSLYLMLTIPFVLYGVFRYIYLIHIENKGGSPEEVFLEDKPLLADILLYSVSVAIILYFS